MKRKRTPAEVREYHAAYRRDERRRARNKREADQRERESRAAARMAEMASTLTARQLYALEKAKRIAAGKPVLKPYRSMYWEESA